MVVSLAAIVIATTTMTPTVVVIVIGVRSGAIIMVIEWI
jgi:hypothetical protein